MNNLFKDDNGNYPELEKELADDLPEEYVTPQELLMEQAEILRDSMREDGINRASKSTKL